MGLYELLIQAKAGTQMAKEELFFMSVLYLDPRPFRLH